VLRLKHGGNCDPEPLAGERFARLMHNAARVAVKVLPPAPIASLAGTSAKVALMTGTGEFTLSDDQKRAIKAFVEGGGTLVVDAAGGPRFRKDAKTGINRVSGFAASAEAAIEDIFGPGSLRRLPSTSPVLNAPGMAVGRARYRLRTEKRLGGTRLTNLRAVLFDGRPGVIYSREDITAGLVGFEASTVDGYAPSTAFRILASIVLSASGVKALAPAATSTPKATPEPKEAKPGPGKGKGRKGETGKAKHGKTPGDKGGDDDILAPQPKYSPPGSTTAP